MLSKLKTGFIIVVLISLAWLGLGYYSAVTKSVVQDRLVVEIEKGASFGEIIQKLRSQNIAVSPFWFKAIAYQQGVINKLKPGEYELTPGLTIKQIMTMLAEGKAITYSITFPEGWNLKEVLQLIAQNPFLEKKLLDSTPANIAAQLGIKESNPEGWFFPDTYQFEKNTTDLSILKRAHSKMQAVLEEEWQHKESGLPYKTPYDALTMASIVEEETGAKHERAMIAGVFVRRLAKGMLLQTDPTVIYGMGDRYKGNIRANDLTKATPYNTYVIQGLPPTPIAMPGRDAIRAALHPGKDEKLYFVAKGDGSHQFSETLSEHNRAVNEFQKHKVHSKNSTPPLSDEKAKSKGLAPSSYSSNDFTK